MLNNNFNNLGFLIIAVFIAAWVLSYAIYRLKKLDQIKIEIE